MHQVAIGIGGSGARVMECLLHLCLAGLGPERLTVFLIDIDGSNGNITQLRELLEDYRRAAADPIRAKDVTWAHTKVTMHGVEAWSPIASGAGGQDLESFLELAHVQALHPGLALLLRTCYSTSELSQDLRGGFRAMPSIGAAVFGATIDKSAEAWSSLAQEIDGALAVPSEARVIVAGSAFGGTGASGFPTVPRRLRPLIKQPTGSLRLGGILLLPYFGFKRPDAADIVARAEDFTVQTHAALTYYAGYGSSLGYDRVYMLGDANRAEYEPAVWGPEQKNPVHFVELLGALACLDFFDSPIAEISAAPVAYIGRRSKGEFTWSDIPPVTDRNVQQVLGHSARVALAWHSTLLPAFESWFLGKWQFHNSPWLVSFLEHQGLMPGDGRLREVTNAYSRLLGRHLRWMHRLTGTESVGKAGTKVSLFQSGAVSFPSGDSPVKVDASEIPAFAGETSQSSWTAEWILGRLNAERSSRLKKRGAEGFGILQSALWNACA